MSGHFRRFALRPVDGISREPLSDGRHFHGDPKRLGLCRSPTSLRFSLCCLAPRVFLGVGRLLLCFRVGFCCLTLSFGLRLGGSPRLGFCRSAPSFRLCLGGAALLFFRCFALRFLGGFSPSFRLGSFALRFCGRFVLRFCFRDPSRLGFCCLTLSFGLRLGQAPRLGFCRLALRLYFGRLPPGFCLGGAALFFRRSFALRFLSGFSPSFRLGSFAVCLFGLFTLRFRFGHSPRFRFFRPTSCFGIRRLTLGLRFDHAASFRLFSGLAPRLRFRGSPRLGFGRPSLLRFSRALLLRLGSPTLRLLVRRASLRGFLCASRLLSCPPLLLSHPRRVGLGLPLRRARCPLRANPDDSLGGATAEELGEVESRPASRHRGTAHADDRIAGWSAPHFHDRPREGSGLLATRRHRHRLRRLG
jgi:hypothetical protein